MILYLPTLYEDETIYSFLSRAYEKGGYLSHTQAEEEFFKMPRERKDFIFCNNLSEDIMDYFTRKYKWESIIENHTLCNYYGRFLPQEKRRRAMESLISLSGNYNNLFSITPNRKGKEFLRYCPVCVKESRERYGETYWNRIHQIPELAVCPIHKCKLLNSAIEKDRHKTRIFNTAENNIKNLESEMGTDIEIKIAEYIDTMVHTPIKVDENICPSEFLVSQMEDTQYLSNRGQIINVGLLYKDMMRFYNELNNGIQMEWQISKVLHGERINPYEIIQIGIFLNISPERLMECKLPDKKPEEKFDEKVIEMLCTGKSSYQISKELDVSATLVRLIKKNYGVPTYSDPRYSTKKSENIQGKIVRIRKIWREEIEKYSGYSFTKICETSEYGLQLRWLRRNDYEWTSKHFPQKRKSQVKSIRLAALDKEYFPQMEAIIDNYKEAEGEMPKRITVSAINRFMGLNNRDLYEMKKCKKIVEKYTESQEEYWVRKIIWAISVIEKENMQLRWNNVKKLVHISNADFNVNKEFFLDKIGKEIIDTISPSN